MSAQTNLFDQRPAMHYARLESSKRLQRLDALLSDGQPHTTLDIVQHANICAVNSAVSELRRNGRVIECDHRVKADSRIFTYRMVV